VHSITLKTFIGECGELSSCFELLDIIRRSLEPSSLLPLLLASLLPEFRLVLLNGSLIILSFSDFNGLDLTMLMGSWKCSPSSSFLDFSCFAYWFLESKVRMSKFSSSKNIFFFFKFKFKIFSYFLIGLLLLSIFWRITCMKLVWHLVSIRIFLTALQLPQWGFTGGFRPWTIRSVF